MIGKGNDCLTPLYMDISKIDSKYKPFLKKAYLRIPCGHCINCKVRRSQEWCLRLAMEATQWKDIHFVTLTFNDNFVWTTNLLTGEILQSLITSDIQKYVKRLRSALARNNFYSPIRYYAVGEYGPKTNRPHYHLLVFGVPDSLSYLFRDCWKYGFTCIKPFYPETCAYVAGYVQKKLYGPDARLNYGSLFPPFSVMSHHLGEKWFFDKVNLDNIIHNGFVMFQGYKHAIPKTFRRKLIAMGYLPESNLIVVNQKQLNELMDLNLHCEAQSISIDDYFRAFREESIRKHLKKNITRDKEKMSL